MATKRRDLSETDPIAIERDDLVHPVRRPGDPYLADQQVARPRPVESGTGPATVVRPCSSVLVTHRRFSIPARPPTAAAHRHPRQTHVCSSSIQQTPRRRQRRPSRSADVHPRVATQALSNSSNTPRSRSHAAETRAQATMRSGSEPGRIDSSVRLRACAAFRLRRSWSSPPVVPLCNRIVNAGGPGLAPRSS